MQLFELVSPRLFRPLAGPNRAFYAELLLLLWEECRHTADYSISRAEAVSRAEDYFAALAKPLALDADGAGDEDEQPTRDPHTLAVGFLLRLRRTGWLEEQPGSYESEPTLAFMPEVTRWLRWTPHKDVAETQELLSAWALLYPNEDYYQWAIVEKATGQVFGSISIYNSLLGEPAQRNEWPGFDLSEGIWEPGYCIGRAWWGKGCTTEALKALVEYWFKNTDSNWLACSHAVENPASGKVMMKAGFVYDHEAVYHKFDGTAIPCKCYTLTREYYGSLYSSNK